MIIERLVEKIPVKSKFSKLILGSLLTALAISLGMVGILSMFDFSIDPVIPATVAVIGAAAYSVHATKMQK